MSQKVNEVEKADVAVGDVGMYVYDEMEVKEVETLVLRCVNNRLVFWDVGGVVKVVLGGLVFSWNAPPTSL